MVKIDNRQNQYVAILLCSLMITGFAQFRLGILVQYFTISLGIVLIPLFYVVIEGFPILPVSVLSGILVAVSRMVVDTYGTVVEVGPFVSNYLPETFFYMLYGFLFYAYCERKGRRLNCWRDVAALALIDYASNMLELFLREGISQLTLYNQASILAIGFARGLIIFGLAGMLRSYRVSLMRQEDVKMYRQLLITTTELSAEMIWMRENMQLVEQTMNDAYRIYDSLKEKHPQEAIKALSVATKVHEIKKQYHSIMTGVSAALNRNLEAKDMAVAEILSILLGRIREAGKEQGITLNCHTNCPENLYTEKYYYMMTLFNNLFTNALEAAVGEEQEISVTVSEEEGDYVFAVSNSGKEIPKEDMQDIWNAGYSTKINYESGVVGRGLGLIIVRRIVEQEFGGKIDNVRSENGWTTFCLRIPKDRFIQK